MSRRESPLRDALVARVRLLLAGRDDVEEKRMFGGVAFMVAGRLAVSAGREGDLLVRTDPAEFVDHTAAGAQMVVMGERSMGRGWLAVPPGLIEDDAQLARWIRVGVESRS